MDEHQNSYQQPQQPPYPPQQQPPLQQPSEWSTSYTPQKPPQWQQQQPGPDTLSPAHKPQFRWSMWLAFVLLALLAWVFIDAYLDERAWQNDQNRLTCEYLNNYRDTAEDC